MTCKQSSEYRETMAILDRLDGVLDGALALLAPPPPADPAALRADVERKLRALEARNARLDRALAAHLKGQ